MAANTPSIGPGAIADPGTQGGPAFNLSKPEWIAIQNYVTDGLSLPITLYQFRNQLGSGAPADLSDFNQLITAYGAVHEHCNSWQTSIFPNTVALASDIFEYGNNKVPVYYPAIVEEANVLTTDPGNTAAAAALAAILGYLQQTASGYAAKAKASSDAIKLFSEAMQSDQKRRWSAPRPSPGCSNITPPNMDKPAPRLRNSTRNSSPSGSRSRAMRRNTGTTASSRRPRRAMPGSGRSGPSRRGSSRANSDTRPSRR